MVMELTDEQAKRAFQVDIRNGKPLVFHSGENDLGQSEMEAMYFGTRNFLASFSPGGQSPGFSLNFRNADGGYRVKLVPDESPPVKFSTASQQH